MGILRDFLQRVARDIAARGGGSSNMSYRTTRPVSSNYMANPQPSSQTGQNIGQLPSQDTIEPSDYNACERTDGVFQPLVNIGNNLDEIVPVVTINSQQLVHLESTRMRQYDDASGDTWYLSVDSENTALYLQKGNTTSYSTIDISVLGATGADNLFCGFSPNGKHFYAAFVKNNASLDGKRSDAHWTVFSNWAVNSSGFTATQTSGVYSFHADDLNFPVSSIPTPSTSSIQDLFNEGITGGHVDLTTTRTYNWTNYTDALSISGFLTNIDDLEISPNFIFSNDSSGGPHLYLAFTYTCKKDGYTIFSLTTATLHQEWDYSFFFIDAFNSSIVYTGYNASTVENFTITDNKTFPTSSTYSQVFNKTDSYNTTDPGFTYTDSMGNTYSGYEVCGPNKFDTWGGSSVVPGGPCDEAYTVGAPNPPHLECPSCAATTASSTSSGGVISVVNFESPTQSTMPVWFNAFTSVPQVLYQMKNTATTYGIGSTTDLLGTSPTYTKVQISMTHHTGDLTNDPDPTSGLTPSPPNILTGVGQKWELVSEVLDPGPVYGTSFATNHQSGWMSLDQLTGRVLDTYTGGDPYRYISPLLVDTGISEAAFPQAFTNTKVVQSGEISDATLVRPNDETTFIAWNGDILLTKYVYDTVTHTLTKRGTRRAKHTLPGTIRDFIFK